MAAPPSAPTSGMAAMAPLRKLDFAHQSADGVAAKSAAPRPLRRIASSTFGGTDAPTRGQTKKGRRLSQRDRWTTSSDQEAWGRRPFTRARGCARRHQQLSSRGRERLTVKSVFLALEVKEQPMIRAIVLTVAAVLC